MISLADIADYYRITRGTKHDKVMRLHIDSKVVKFGQTRSRLHGLDPKHDNAHAPKQFKR